MSIFPSRLKWLRDKKGFTQKKMSEVLELSQSYYSKFEYGQREPNLDTLTRLPSILGESLDFILGVIDFDHHAEQLFADYKRTLTHCKVLDEQLMLLITNPFSKELPFPVEPSEVQEKIKTIQGIKPNAIQRLEEAKSKLLSYLDTIPGVKEETLEKIKTDTL